MRTSISERAPFSLAHMIVLDNTFSISFCVYFGLAHRLRKSIIVVGNDRGSHGVLSYEHERESLYACLAINDGDILPPFLKKCHISFH